MAEEIKISIGADTSQMQANLVKAQNTLKQFQAALQKATNIGEIKYLQRNISLLETEIMDLGSAMNTTASSFNNLKSNSGQATNTLTSLSRVVQDAPFGFMAISNNINPLLESFQRLKEESGSTGSAMKSLIGTLSGGAGLGFAVSLATSLLVSFGDALGGNKQQAEQSNVAYEAMTKRLENIKSGFDEASKSIEYNTEVQYKAYYGIKDLSNAYATNEDDIVRLKLKNRDLFDEINVYSNRTLPNLEQSLNDAQAALDRFYYTRTEGSKRSKFESYQEASDAAVTSEAYIDLAKARDEAQKAFTEGQYKIQDLQDQQKLLVLDIKNAEANLENQRAADAKKEADRKAKEMARLNTVAKELDKLKETYRDIARFSIVMSEANQTITAPDFLNKKDIKVGGEALKQEYQAVLETLEILVKEFNLDENNKIVIGLKKDAARLAALSAMVEFENALKPIQLPEVQVPTKLMTKSFETWKKSYDKFKADQAAYAAKKEQDYTNIIMSLSMDSATQIGAVLGQGLYAAITGQSNGLISAFQGLFSLFGDAVISLGKYAILYSTAMEKLKAALIGAKGLAGIGIGIGLIALGTLIKSAMSGLGKASAFAVGTRFAPGGMALVGERGPELVNLPRGSQVVPSAQTSAMMEGVGGKIEVFGMLRGQDIYFSNKKYGQTYNRQT